MDETFRELTPVKKTFSRIGLAFSAILLITVLLQVLLSAAAAYIWGADNWLADSSWGMWILTFVPLYLVAIPLGLLILRKLPASAPASIPLKTGHFLILLPICFLFTYAGSYIGTFLSSILSGGQAQNALDSYVMDTNPIKILVIVIFAPLLEEYICRKQLIDRTRQYGEKLSVLLSALIFALFHTNLFQFFYAFAGGLVFAYIYLRTGRLRYPVLLHSIINFMGSVVAPWITSFLDIEAINSIDPNAAPEALMATYSKILPGLLLSLLYAAFLIGMSIAGLVLLILKAKELVWKEAESPLPKEYRFKIVYVNVGMILYGLVCLIFTALSLF